MDVVTDHKWRDLKNSEDVPDHIKRDEFDWLDDAFNTDGFFKYRNFWYHLEEFMRADSGFTGWHAYKSDSAFSGVLIRVSDDGEQVMCATYTS